MKRVEYHNDNGGYLIIGTAREIKSLENRLRKTDRGIIPVFTESAQYNMDKIYGMDIYFNCGKWLFTIINSDTIAWMVMNDII